MNMHFVHEFVETVLVAGTHVDKCLDGLVGVCRNILTLTAFDYGDGIVGKCCEIGNAIVNIGGFVYAD